MILGLFEHQPLSEHVHHMMTQDEKDKLSKLLSELIVFRGHAESLLKGISWTLSHEIALQYAIGSPLKSSFSVGTVKKTEVIAFIDRWDEDEIIIPFNSVSNIKTFRIPSSE
jgi:hypothetical protein